MTQKDKMLRMVLENPALQKDYEYSASDFADIYDALNAENPVVVAIAKIIKDYSGSDDLSEQKRVYKTIFTYLNDNLLS